MAWWWYQGPLQLGDLSFGTVEAILCQLPSTGASSIENLVPTRTPPWYSNPNDGFLLWSDGWCSAAGLMHVSCHRPCQPLPSASSGWVNLWWWISQRGQGLNISSLQTLKLLLIWNNFFTSSKITLAPEKSKGCVGLLSFSHGCSQVSVAVSWCFPKFSQGHQTMEMSLVFSPMAPAAPCVLSPSLRCLSKPTTSKVSHYWLLRRQKKNAVIQIFSLPGFPGVTHRNIILKGFSVQNTYLLRLKLSRVLLFNHIKNVILGEYDKWKETLW